MASLHGPFPLLALKRRLQRSSDKLTWAHHLPVSGSFVHIGNLSATEDCERALIEEAEDQSAGEHLYVSLVDVISLIREEKGSRQIQRAIEDAASEKERLSIVSQFHGHVIELSQCPFGNFVIQKVIEVVRSSDMQFIIDEIFCTQSGIVGLAASRYGCRILQRVLDYARDDQLSELVNLILSYALEIARNQFGKFVLMHILPSAHEEKPWARSTMDALVRCAGEMCLDTHGSHVISMALDVADERDQQAIICSFKDNISFLSRLAHCRFGHAIVLKVLASLTESELTETWDELRAATPNLSRGRYGKLLLRRLTSLHLS